MARWLYGPDNEARIFEDGDEVPAGWADHPCKVKGGDPKPADVVKAVADMAVQIEVMDGDGDGRIGGSKPKAQRKPRKVKRNGPRK